MTGRERLLKAIKLESVDRVPVSTFPLLPPPPGTESKFSPELNDLLDYTYENTDLLFPWGYELMANARENDLLEIKTWKEGSSTYKRTVLHTPGKDLTSLERRDDSVNTNWLLEPLLKDVDDIDKYLSIPFELKKDERVFSEFERRKSFVGSRGIIYTDLGDPVGWACTLLGFETFLSEFMLNRQKILKLMDALFERQFEALRFGLESGAGEMFRLQGAEYASPPFVDPELFPLLVNRYDGKFVEIIHDSGRLAAMHCHGNLKPILFHILDMNVDAVEPVEPPPDGDITLVEAKRLMQGNACVMGNLEFRELEFADTTRIDMLVKKSMDEAKEGYGYVIMPSASPIVYDVSRVMIENYFKFINTALLYGKY